MNLVLYWQKGKTMEVKIDGIAIPQVHHTRFPGVILDDELTWIHHIHHIWEKLRANKHLLQMGRNFLNHDSLLSVYYAHIYSHLSYSLSTWGRMLSKSDSDDLLKIQNCCICIVHKNHHVQTVHHCLR